MDMSNYKLPPDSRRPKVTRQSTPMPNGEPFGDAKLTRRTRRKMTETPIEAIVKMKNVTNIRTEIECTETSKTKVKFSALPSNGTSTPPAASQDDSPSLWLKKTPEEILDFYRQLGPNWRNEFEKTDLTYSPGSPWYNKEVVPGSGIPVIPNMSREPVGAYARSMRGRAHRTSDLHSYTSDTHRTQTYLSYEDKRASLSYGLNHSPSTPLTRIGYPSHAYPQVYSSNYSSSSSTNLISRTRTVLHSTVSMVTKLFTLVITVVSLAWSWRNHSTQSSQDEGVDTVDNGYYLRQRTAPAGVQNYEYKTGAKRSSMHHRTTSSRSFLSIWSHTLFTSVYSFTSWLIVSNSRMLSIKEEIPSLLQDQTRNRAKYVLLAIVLLLFGFWLFCPLISSNTNSTIPLPSNTDTKSQDIREQLSATGVWISSIKASVQDSLYATGKYLPSPFSGDFTFLTAPFTAAGDVLSVTPATLYHYASIPVVTVKDILSTGLKLSGNAFYWMWNIVCSLVHAVRSVLYEGVQIVVLTGAGLVSSMKALSTTAFESKVPPYEASVTQSPDSSIQQEQMKLQQAGYIPQGPTVEEIVLKVLSDVRFTNMIQHNVKINVEMSGDKQMKETQVREKELQEKVTELCTRLVESEIIKYKSTVEEERKQESEHVQSAAPATVSITDSEDIQRYRTQVQELISSIQSLESEHQTSFLDLMTKFSGLIDDKIKTAFAIYDAARTGLTDYALESAGGTVINIRCTETYTLKDPYYVLFGYALWRRDSSPRKAIQPGLLPGDCWAFQGAVGCLVLKLSHRIKITKFSMEHIPRALTPTGEIDSAPKKFSVWGLKENYDEKPVFLGEFAYDKDGPTLQYFEAKDSTETFDMVELKVLSNHGNIEYTCLYRFRVHGSLASATPSSSNYQAHLSANHNTYRHHVSPSHSTKYNPV